MTIDLSKLAWTVSGWQPWLWKLGKSMELGHTTDAEVAPLPCPVPGSVQQALKNAGLLPDWNAGLNARACEWVENRHWIVETQLPAVPPEQSAILVFQGIDGNGDIYLDGIRIKTFSNAFLPVQVDLGGLLNEGSSRRLRVVFHCPPRWLGQIGVTSEIRDWKPRFNYTWDWIPRLVQIGIFGDVRLVIGESGPAPEVLAKYLPDENAGLLEFSGGFPSKQGIRIRVMLGKREISSLGVAPGETPSPLHIPDVETWNPVGHGGQALYDIEFHCADGMVKRRVGFREISWQPCEGSPPEADPWLCVVNGRPLFLQGINWTPIRPLFADLQKEEYLRRLTLYRDLGFNAIRVWGGGFPEYDWLYDLCDEMGILVWQDFFLSSSGLENCPPEDPVVIAEAEAILEHQVLRLRSRPSLLIWCGGNELQDKPIPGDAEPPPPAGLNHQLLAALAAVCQRLDRGRRFVPSTSSGPRFSARAADFGKGLHWDVHGPWRSDRVGVQPWQHYWTTDDALFRSEMGHPGAQSRNLTEKYKGECNPLDARRENPYWARFGWWFDMGDYTKEKTVPDLDDYIAWSQQQQAEILSFAVREVKSRFPRCGGLLIWMGHDCFPCPVNTSLLDFDGKPKPVCAALRNILLGQVP